MATGTAAQQTVDVVTPAAGESVTEGTILEWHVKVGDFIKADDTIVEISTDKVDLELPSPASGAVSEILIEEGETVTVGQVIARITVNGGPAPAASDGNGDGEARAPATGGDGLAGGKPGIREGLVGGEAFAIDASLIKADANRQKGVEGEKGLPPEATSRAVKEYLAVLDDEAFGAATDVVPKFVSPADPAARWTGAHGGQAFFAYSTNYLIDVDNAIIVDVEATTAIRQAEVLAAKRMIERSIDRFDLYPARLLGDSAYGSAEMLGWLVYEHGIEPHVTVFDKSTRQDGTFSRDDFTYDDVGDVYYCPAGKMLTTTGSRVNDGATLRYRASKYDCEACRLKPRCCPKEPARYVPRSIYEGARDMARQIARSWQGRTARRLRKKVEMLFAHLKRILRLDRLRLRGPNGARDEFLLAATAQNLRKLAKLIPMPSPRPA